MPSASEPLPFSAPERPFHASESVRASADHGADYGATAFVFILACFIGLGVIRGVSRLLHTPLMSLTNAISAIAVLGAILLAGGEHSDHIHWLGAIAVFASTINAVSGFLITHRMLGMFKSKKDSTARSER